MAQACPICYASLMETVRAYISLGSNSPRAEEKLAAAAAAIGALDGVCARAASSLYHTEPQEDRSQPWFVNQVLAVDVPALWTPECFLQKLLALESALGRVRDPARRFGPREIDIDLLLFGVCKTAARSCIVPHPRMRRRAFVLCPLLEIAPDITIDGEKAADILGGLAYKVAGSRIWQNG